MINKSIPLKDIFRKLRLKLLDKQKDIKQIITTLIVNFNKLGI